MTFVVIRMGAGVEKKRLIKLLFERTGVCLVTDEQTYSRMFRDGRVGYVFTVHLPLDAVVAYKHLAYYIRLRQSD